MRLWTTIKKSQRKKAENKLKINERPEELLRAFLF